MLTPVHITVFTRMDQKSCCLKRERYGANPISLQSWMWSISAFEKERTMLRKKGKATTARTTRSAGERSKVIKRRVRRFKIRESKVVNRAVTCLGSQAEVGFQPVANLGSISEIFCEFRELKPLHPKFWI